MMSLRWSHCWGAKELCRRLSQDLAALDDRAESAMVSVRAGCWLKS
jgi:hypothetical protein